MNESLREVANALYEVGNSLSCKVCVKCKVKVDNEHLSCVDCIEEGLKNLIDRATPKKTHSVSNTDGEPCLPRYMVVCNSCECIVHEFDSFCRHCGQRLEARKNEK